MVGRVPLLEKGPDGLMHEISPELAEQMRQSRRYSTVALSVDILFTPEEEAARDKEELAAAVARNNADIARKEAQDKAAAKLEALGLTKDDLKALMG